jgi:hypothetical protein
VSAPFDGMDSSRFRGRKFAATTDAHQLNKEEPDMDATTVGVDLAKTVFELAVANAAWHVVGRKRLTRPCWQAIRDAPRFRMVQGTTGGPGAPTFSDSFQKRRTSESAEERLVSLTFASWNQVAGWLRQLRQSSAPSELEWVHFDSGRLTT